MRYALTLLSLLAAPALAECPTADDVAGGGVWVSYADNWATHTRRTDRGTTLEVAYIPEEDGYFIESERMIHIVADGPWKDGAPVAAETTRYEPIDGTTLPEPTPGMRWSGRLRVILGDGSTGTARQVINAADMSEMTIGDCTYRALPLHLVYEAEDKQGHASALSLLPDLGIVVLTGAGEVGQPYSESYRATAISRRAP